MMALRKWHVGLLALIAAFGCDMFAGGSSNQDNAVAGGSSDQGNAIQVRVLDRWGLPVVGARLEVLPADWASSDFPDSGSGVRSAVVFLRFQGMREFRRATGALFDSGPGQLSSRTFRRRLRKKGRDRSDVGGSLRCRRSSGRARGGFSLRARHAALCRSRSGRKFPHRFASARCQHPRCQGWSTDSA